MSIPWYRDKDKLTDALTEHGSYAGASRSTGVAASTLKTAGQSLGLPEQPRSRAKLRLVKSDQI